jgi:hypothetical protein
MIRKRSIALVSALLAVVLAAAGCVPPPEQTPQEAVASIIEHVERIRGHEFVTDPEVQFVDPSTFEADVLTSLAAEEPDIAPDETAFVALDWLDGSQDLITEYRKTYGGGVVGYYDPTDDVLKVRGTEITPYRREVIAHELTHALDDQIFDLSDLDSVGLLDTDYVSQLIAIEGSAERVRNRYARTFTPLETLQSLQEQLNAASDPALLTIPITLLTLTSAPYLRGARFQDQLVAALGNPGGPDASLTRYPANTEQGFDTDKYLADEQADEIPAPPTDSGAPAVRSGEFGPLLLSLVLREGIVLDSLDPLTEGWDGGSYTSWESTTGACIRVDTRWDTSGDASAVADALDSWGSRHAGTSVESTSTTDVRLTRCD